MTVEEIRVENGHSYEQFPMGLRVLAVDDDPTCLKLLETLLKICHYNVTTTSQARNALEMLRENKDGFDLVISDVYMPDMDGFRLLELVGLEMDLPVIMLSGNSDPENVMKGVAHGACDYLVKPVRLEELRNIFQHVVRKKKVDPKNPKRPTGQNQAHQASEEGRGPPLPDQNEKFIRKRKDEEDDSEENRNESDHVKKPRVVWSMELHTKFVAAVSQLGFDKAVPKKILELMNDNSLTRENVASHLQKFRLYLKRISLDRATQHAAMRGSPLMRTGPLNGPGDYRSLTGPGPFRNVPLSPFTTGAGFGRLNSPSSVNLGNRAPSSLVQTSQPQNFVNSIPTLGKTQPVNQNPCLLQGVQSGFEQQNKGVSGIPSFNTVNDSRMFTTPGTGIGCSSNLLNDSFNVGISGSSNLLDPGRCNDSWQNSIESSNSLNGAYLQNKPFENSTQGVNGHFHNMNSGGWGEVERQNYPQGSTNNTFGSHIPANGIVSPLDHSSVIFNQKNENEKSQVGFVPQSSDPLDELVNAIMIPVRDDMPNCDFEFDEYPFGPAI